MKLVIGAFVVLLVAAVRWWARKHPNRSKQYPDQRRMVKFVPVVGWLLVIVGSLMIPLVIFTDDEDATAMRIACVAILLGGTAFVLMYRNFYVAPRDYEVAFRTVLGKEHVITYTDIAQYNVTPPFVQIKSAKGVKLNLNTSIYDLTPLLRAIEFRDATGRWPVRPQAAPQNMAG